VHLSYEIAREGLAAASERMVTPSARENART
jgi:hypothetical protein